MLTAQEQHFAYEVEKKYVWRHPIQCEVCRARLVDLRRQDRESQEKWNLSRATLRSDPEFIGNWRAVLRQISTLGRGNSMQTHLKQLLWT